MSESTMVILLALLCSFITVVGLASVVPWDYIRRSFLNRMAARLANTGMKEKSIQALPSIIYAESIQQLPGGNTIASDCPICLAEFVEGDVVKVLPCCNHGFHMECIGKWLRSHSCCPVCRHYLRFYGCKKLANLIQRSNSNAHEGQIHQPRTSHEDSMNL